MSYFEAYWGKGSKAFMYLAISCLILFCIFLFVGKNTHNSLLTRVNWVFEIASIGFAALCFILSFVLLRRQVEFDNKDLSKSDNEVVLDKKSVIEKYKNLGLISEKSYSCKDQ